MVKVYQSTPVWLRSCAVVLVLTYCAFFQNAPLNTAAEASQDDKRSVFAGWKASADKEFAPFKAWNDEIAVLQNRDGDEAPQTDSLNLRGTFDELIRKAEEGGSARIIVGLQTEFKPEGFLRSNETVSQRTAIQTAQNSLLNKLDSFAKRNVKQFEFIPYMALEVDAAALEFMKSAPEVIFIQEDKDYAPSLAESTPVVGANASWTAGLSGNGWTIAILDTGVDKNHPFLSGKVVSEACYSSTFTSGSPTFSSYCPSGAASSTASNSGLNCTASDGGCDHGTHVAGIAAGNDGSTGADGVARDSNIISIQVFSRRNSDNQARTFTSDYIKGLERVYALRNTYNIAAANMSLGGGGTTTNCDVSEAATKAAIDNLRSVNIATIISSGNDGFTNGLSDPACISSAVSVGSTRDGGGDVTTGSVDTPSSFSNSASFLSILAPGETINSSVLGTSYGTKNGTSMAAPHVAGAWAILKERMGDATVQQILNRLRNTGVPVTDSRNSITKNRIQIDAAIYADCNPSITPGSANIIGAGATANFSLTISSDCGWTALSNVPWITTSSSSAGGSGTITYTVAANPGTSSRTGTISVAGQVFTVTQGVNCLPTFSSNNAAVGGSGGGGNLVVSYQAACSTASVSSNQSWLTFTISGNTISYSVAANTTGANRTGTITITGADGSATFTVTQSSCVSSVAPTNVNPNDFGGTSSFNVAMTSGCSYTATSNQSWVTITSGASGGSSGTVVYSVAPNTTQSTRTAVISVTGGGTHTITQDAAPACTYTLSATERTINRDSGNYSFTVQTNRSHCTWTAAVTSSNSSWVTITQGSSGTGTGQVQYSATANPNTTARTATITAGGKQYTITQTAACTYSLLLNSLQINANGGTSSITAITQDGCGWSAASNDSWISITGNNSGAGNGTISIAVQPNTSSTNARRGSVSIAGQTFRVYQSAADIPCLPRNTLSWYRGEDNMNDIVSANNGTAVGSPTYVTSSRGKAFSFDGNDAVQIQREISGEFSIEFWMKTAQTGGSESQWYQGYGLVDAEVSGVTNDFGVSLGNGKVLFGTGNGDTTIRTPTAVNDNQWHHIVATRLMSGHLRIYLDGVQVALTNTGSQANLTAPANIRFGSLQTNIGFYNGLLDEVKIYDYALSASDVQAAAANNCAGGTNPSLSINNQTITEGNSSTTNAVFTVTLSPVASQTVMVDYTTQNASATAGTDYTATSGTLTFAAGETTKTVSVPVIGDTADEANETFNVRLSNQTNALVSDNEGVGTIIDDDDPSGQGTQYNARDEFSLTQGGTTGMWRYGSTANDASNAFVPYTLTRTADCGGSPANGWIFRNDGDQTPVIYRYQATCNGTPPDSLHVHPGPSGQRTVLRWVAPVAGTYQLTGVLQRANPNATTDLRILKNETTSLFTGSIVSTYQQPFDFTVTVAANDTIDFSVGYGNGSYHSDGSTLNVTVGQPVTACQTAPANLQVFVPGENSPNDVQSGGIGTLVGNATYDAGKVGQALKFDGNGDYVRIEDSAAQKPANQLTVEGWFYLNSVTNQALPHLVSKPLRNNSLNSYALWYNGSLRIGYQPTGASWIEYGTGYQPTLNVWNHYAFVLNTDDTGEGANTAKLYVNGIQVFSGAANNPIFYNGSDGLTPHPLLIGGEFEGNTPQWGMQGLADEVSIYGRALTQSEIFNTVRQGSFAKCGSGAPCVTAPSNQVAWFRGENNANDSQGTNNGTNNGATFAAGRVGQAMSFDGVDDYVSVPDSDALDITGDLTIEGWVYPTSNTGRLVSKQTVEGYKTSYILELNNGKLLFYGNDNTTSATHIYQSTTLSVPLNQWSHIAFTLSGSGISFVVNGTAESHSGAYLGVHPATDGPLYIGTTRNNGAPNGHAFFSGRIDELSLYNRVLTTAELQTIFNAGSAGKCLTTAQCVNAPGNQVSWFRGEGNANDSQGSNNGTNTGVTYNTGKVGQAFFFDSNADTIATNTSFNQPYAQLSAEAWVYPTSHGQGGEGVEQFGRSVISNTESDGFNLGVRNGFLQVDYRLTTVSGSQPLTATTNQLALNQWSHIAMTYNGSVIKGYVNGVEVISQNATGTIRNVTNANSCLMIGNNPTGSCVVDDRGFSWRGGIDEPSIFNRGLSASEIQSIYNVGSAGKCGNGGGTPTCTAPPSDMLAWYPGESNANDISGNNNGTLQNGATFAAGKVGQGIKFDGVDDSVSIPDAAALKPQNITVETWVKFDSLSSNTSGGRAERNAVSRLQEKSKQRQF
jgi:hypothetical protein